MLNKEIIKELVNMSSSLNIKEPNDKYTYEILIYNRYYNILNLKSGFAELMFYK